MEDKRYPIELEVITPLSVGAGNDNEWVKGLDFVQKDNKVYILDMHKVAAAGVDVEVLTQLFLKSDHEGISQLLGNKIDELSRYIFALPAKTDNNIKTFLRTQFFDKPVVAGSSIKGSVRSALFNYLRTNEDKNEEVFGTMKDGTDFMRFVRIGDVEMPSTVLVNTKIFNLRGQGSEWQGGWKHRGTDREGNSHTDGHYIPVGFNTLYECVAPGKKGLGNISLAANAFSLLEKYGQGKKSYASKKQSLLNEPISSLFRIINDVTRGYLEKERAFFEKYSAERSDEVLDNIDELLSMIPADDSCCLLKMSAGVGFHAITGDWQFEDYDKTKFWTEGRNAGKKKYKSRKIAEYNKRLQLMGFVRLRALSKQEALERELALQQLHDDHQAELLDAIKLREANLLRKQEEELLRLQAAEREKQKRETFTILLQQAKQCYNEEKWDESISKAEEALKLYPDSDEVAKLIAGSQRGKNIADYQIQEKEATAQKFSQPLEEVIKGKTSAGNLVGTTIKWLKVEDHSFGQIEYDAFIAEARLLTSREKNKLKSRLSDLAKLTGTELTERLYNELLTT